MQKFRKRLLGALPIGLAYALSDNTLGGFGVMLIGGLFLWIPYWLAWWLSDGFSLAGLVESGSDGSEIDLYPAIFGKPTSYDGKSYIPTMSCGINPYTGKPCTVISGPYGGESYIDLYPTDGKLHVY